MSKENQETTRPLEVAELAHRAVVQPVIMNLTTPDGVTGQFAFVPQVEGTGRTTVRLESVAKFADEYRVEPRLRVGTAKMYDLASLIAHVNRFKDCDSVIFADTDRNNPSITAVLDYHRVGATSKPRFGKHLSKYTFPVSDEWLAWTGVHGDEMGQQDFAEFIESHLVDVIDPSSAGESAKQYAEKCGVTFGTPSRLLELSRGLSISVGEKVVQAYNLQSGEKQIQFSETHSDSAGAPLKVPGAFLIGIPVFRADARYQVCVRLRYRKREGSLTWAMDLWRHEEVFDAAIRQACQFVSDGTQLPLFVGTPEV